MMDAKPLSWRMKEMVRLLVSGEATIEANLQTLEQWADVDVKALEAQVAAAEKSARTANEDAGGYLYDNGILRAQVAAMRERITQLETMGRAELQTLGDGRDYSLAAFILRDLEITKEGGLREMCAAASTGGASRGDWDGIRLWWWEAAFGRKAAGG
jgi:hypothetical protein